MTVCIYHNPRCSKSRDTLALLHAQGLTPTVVAYLDTPPDAATLREVLAKLGLSDARALMRKGEAEYTGRSQKPSATALMFNRLP